MRGRPVSSQQTRAARLWDSLACDGPFTGSVGADDTSGEHVTVWNTQPGRQESQRGVSATLGADSISLQGQVINSGLPCGRPVPGRPRRAGPLGPLPAASTQRSACSSASGAAGSQRKWGCPSMLSDARELARNQVAAGRAVQSMPFPSTAATRHPRPPGAASCRLSALPLRAQ